MTPQVAEASAAGLGTEPPSRSENAGHGYIVRIRVGPCSEREAGAALQVAHDAVLALPDDLGAVASLREVGPRSGLT